MLAAAFALVGCDESVGNGTCAEDSDCLEGETCLVDLDRDSSYCVKRCTSDRDCPNFQSCRISAPRIPGLEDTTQSVCVDQIRECSEVELCNGLDDDCDGVVDGAACEVLDGCLDDAPCGGWVCQAPENQPSAVCTPAVEGGEENFSRCTADAECRNGVCETGFCSDFCRPADPMGCRAIFEDGTEYETICARAVGTPSRPKHNKCQVACGTDRSCPNNLTCVWRDVYQGGDAHHFVCAIPDPNRKALGAECTNNDPDEGDDECQSGLCYGRKCTRSCGGPGSDCSDVGSNYECDVVDLFYGELTIGAFICLEGS